jgi:hypothetical protein
MYGQFPTRLEFFSYMGDGVMVFFLPVYCFANLPPRASNCHPVLVTGSGE